MTERQRVVDEIAEQVMAEHPACPEACRRRYSGAGARPVTLRPRGRCRKVCRRHPAACGFSC